MQKIQNLNLYTRTELLHGLTHEQAESIMTPETKAILKLLREKLRAMADEGEK